MIRRWSRVNNTIENIVWKKRSFFPYFYLSFKKSIIFKRLRFKNTKFKRKTLIRAKHKGNWIIYLQIINNWAVDFKFAKSYVKYQLYANLTENSFLIYDLSLIDNTKKADLTKTFCISNHLTKKTSLFLTQFNFWTFTSFIVTNSFLQNINDFHLYVQENSILIPIYFYLGNLFYEIDNFPDMPLFDFDPIKYCHLIYHLQLNHLKWIYKILTDLWVFKLLNP